MHGSETSETNKFTEKENELIARGFTQDEIYQIRADQDEMKKEAKEWEQKNGKEEWKEDPFWNERVVEVAVEKMHQKDAANGVATEQEEKRDIFIGRRSTMFDKIKGMFSQKSRPYDILGPGTKVNIVQDGDPESGSIESIDGSKMFIRYESGALGIMEPQHIKDVTKEEGKYYIHLQKRRRFKIGG